MICEYLGKAKILLDIGFSTQILFIGALYKAIKNSLAFNPHLYLSSLSLPLGYKNLAPALDRYVQGG